MLPRINLDVAAVGIDNPMSTSHPYLRLTDGTVYRLPDPLRDWAVPLVAVHQHHRSSGNLSMFPCHIEFGVLDGGVYAELLV